MGGVYSTNSIFSFLNFFNKKQIKEEWGLEPEEVTPDDKAVFTDKPVLSEEQHLYLRLDKEYAELEWRENKKEQLRQQYVKIEKQFQQRQGNKEELKALENEVKQKRNLYYQESDNITRCEATIQFLQEKIDFNKEIRARQETYYQEKQEKEDQERIKKEENERQDWGTHPSHVTDGGKSRKKHQRKRKNTKRKAKNI